MKENKWYYRDNGDSHDFFSIEGDDEEGYYFGFGYINSEFDEDLYFEKNYFMNDFKLIAQNSRLITILETSLNKNELVLDYGKRDYYTLTKELLNNPFTFRDTEEESLKVERTKQYDITYLKMAKLWGELSHCERRKVGAIIVKEGQIISDGYNGTPTGFNNCCEESDVTKWSVIHAEANAILKVARSTQSCDGASIYLSLEPCKECCKMILQAGIKRVVYSEHYDINEGIEFLSGAGIIVEHISID